MPQFGAFWLKPIDTADGTSLSNGMMLTGATSNGTKMRKSSKALVSAVPGTGRN